MNPVTLAVVRGAMEQIADEMDLHLIRAAFSPIISETSDCAHGIFDPKTGETIAQGRYGLPLFLANMQLSIQNLLKYVDAEGGFKPGDLWIFNETYMSGTHLQDVMLVSPYFVDGTLFALLSSTGHLMDIGGSVPGGWAPKAQEIHQEGIIIPPIRLQEEGRVNDALIKMITANVRLPDQIAGDIAAMSNVFVGARQGLDALVQRYGVSSLRDCIDEMKRRSEAQMRSYLSDLPNGTYQFEDYIDNDGIVDKPLKIALALTKSGSTLHFDFTGTDDAAKGPLNLGLTTTISSCYIALKHIFPDVPVNGGTFVPTTFTVPEGCLLAARYPSPVSGYLELVCRVVDVVFGALSKAVPNKVPAAFFGTIGVVTIGGRHPETGRYFVGVYPYPGGYGAHSSGDGLVNGTPVQSMANFMSIEMSEHRYPLRFLHYAIRDDSGGAGKHRGGCGTAYGFEVLSPCIVSVLGDRIDNPPFGIAGGGAAAPNEVYFVSDDQIFLPEMKSKHEAKPLKAGDRLIAASPGGGGFGDPLDRNLAAVDRDLQLGYISPATARDDYGVVLLESPPSDGQARVWVDADASKKRREQLRVNRTVRVN